VFCCCIVVNICDCNLLETSMVHVVNVCCNHGSYEDNHQSDKTQRNHSIIVNVEFMPVTFYSMGSMGSMDLMGDHPYSTLRICLFLSTY
jgi:hypothetical protein